MKYKTLAGVGILTVFFLLVAGWLSPGFADDVTRSGVSPRAIELAAQAPKTPEAFLRLVREWMDDPYMDAYVFIERLSGVERAVWEKSPDNLAPKKIYVPFGYIQERKKQFPLNRMVIQINSSNHLWDALIWLPERFCVSAEMVREILGKPNKVSRKMPNKYSEKIPEYTPVIFFRYMSNRYKLKVRFSFNKKRFGNILKLPIEKQKEIYSYIKNPENEKYICASMIRFGTYEGQ